MWYALLVIVSAAVKLNVHDLPAKTMCVNFKVIHDMQETHQQKGNYLSGFQSTMAFPLVVLAPICVGCASVRLRVALVAASVARQSRGTNKLEAQKEDSKQRLQSQRFGAYVTSVHSSTVLPV